MTAYIAEALGARTGLLVFGMAVVLLAQLLTLVWVKDTLPVAKAKTAAHKAAPPKSLPRYPECVSDHPTTGEVFALGSRLIDRQSQNRTVAARATAERRVFAHLS